VSDDDDLLDALPAPSIDEPHIAAVAPPKQIGPRSFPVKTVVVCGIVLLFILAVVDILLDADFISWDVPHTHFLD
jgi:hypothetical protein